MALDITVQPHPCGALVRGIDLTKPLSETQSADVRAAWLKHQKESMMSATTSR